MNVPHPSEERIQEWLDGRLSEADRADVAAHLDACPACRAEVEAWSSLWTDLSSLPSLAPGSALSSRILASVRTEPAPTARSWLARRVGRLRAAVRPPDPHPDGGLLQELLAGSLPERRAALVRAHIEACGRCEGEARAWSELLGRLDALPRHAPSEGFADAVVARLHLESSPAGGGRLATLRRNARAGLRAALGSSGPRRAWAAVAGVALTPMIVLALVTYTVFSHPLVTAGNLTRFLWTKRGSIADALTGGLARNPGPLEVWSWLDLVTRSPGAAATAFLLVTAVTSAAAWILYRNVLSPSIGPVHARSHR